MAAARLSPKTRGYDAHHRALRKLIVKQIAAGGVRCWRCRKPIYPGMPFDLGHDDIDRSIYRGAECIKCNRGAAARKTNMIRRRKRRAIVTRTTTIDRW